jgi:hypothetical protein
MNPSRLLVILSGAVIVLTLASCDLPSLNNTPATHNYYLTATGGAVSFRALISFPEYCTNISSVYNGVAMFVQDSRMGSGVGGAFTISLLVPKNPQAPFDLPIVEAAPAGYGPNADMALSTQGKDYNTGETGNFHFDSWTQTSSGVTFTCTFTFTAQTSTGETISITDGKIAQE